MTIDSYQCHDLSMASSASLSPLVLASNSSSPQPGSPLVKSNGSPNSGTGNSSSSSNIGGSSSSSGGNGVSSGGKPRMVIDWTEWEAEILMTEYETHRYVRSCDCLFTLSSTAGINRDFPNIVFR